MAFDWLRKLFVQDGQPSTVVMSVGSSLGGGTPKPFNLPAKSPAKHQTAADVLDYLCKKYKGYYTRKRVSDGVVMWFYREDGTIVSGRGSDTMSAVAALQKRLEMEASL